MGIRYSGVVRNEGMANKEFRVSVWPVSIESMEKKADIMMALQVTRNNGMVLRMMIRD